MWGCANLQMRVEIPSFLPSFIPSFLPSFPRLPYLRIMKILMVCLGNICRSPLAEGILQHKASRAGLNWVIDSAGTNGYHTGEAPHRLSIKVAALNDIDISNQVSRRFVKKDIEQYDIIYAMAADVMDDIRRIAGNDFHPGKIRLFLPDTLPHEGEDVPDPWYGGEDGYHEVYDLLNRACDALLQREPASLHN
jgi:protein-tyrosine phosphatase